MKHASLPSSSSSPSGPSLVLRIARLLGISAVIALVLLVSATLGISFWLWSLVKGAIGELAEGTQLNPHLREALLRLGQAFIIAASGYFLTLSIRRWQKGIFRILLILALVPLIIFGVSTATGTGSDGLPLTVRQMDPATAEWFEGKTGAPALWYAPGDDGGKEFFNRPGHHPRTGRKLQPVTSEQRTDWLREQKEAEERKAAAEKAKAEAEAKAVKEKADAAAKEADRRAAESLRSIAEREAANQRRLAELDAESLRQRARQEADKLRAEAAAEKQRAERVHAEATAAAEKAAAKRNHQQVSVTQISGDTVRRAAPVSAEDSDPYMRDIPLVRVSSSQARNNHSPCRHCGQPPTAHYWFHGGMKCNHPCTKCDLPLSSHRHVEIWKDGKWEEDLKCPRR